MIKVFGEKVIHETPFVKLVSTHYHDMQGKPKDWVHVDRPNFQHAVVIGATYGDKLVVIREYRVPLRYYEYGFPAGLIDFKESTEEAARRELKEETGLEIDEIQSISPPIYSSAGITSEAVQMVICTAKGTPNQSLNEESEDIKTFLKTREEVAQLLNDSDKLFGAKAYLLMERFVEFGCLYKNRPLYEVID